MGDDLLNAFASLRAQLLADAEITVSASTFSGFASKTVLAPGVAGFKGLHFYGASYHVDQIVFESSREVFQSLGFLVLASMFAPASFAEISVELTSPATEIRAMVFERPAGVYQGLTTSPFEFDFAPENLTRHPFMHEHVSEDDLPSFELTNRSDTILSEIDRAGRDVVRVVGNERGFVRLAGVLLSIGNGAREIDLESDAGVRGVGLASAEVRFALT